MVSRIGTYVVMAALSLSIGLHWNLLQVVAWASMVVRYAQDATVVEALAMTFDGQHPCCMCKAIEKGKQQERQAPQQKEDGSKLQLIAAPCDAWLVPHRPCWRTLPELDQALLMSMEPPVPPPRTV